jgi:hypothetical protein
MSRIDYKELELKRFAEIVMTSGTRQQMVQRLNGFRMGLTNKHGKNKRLDIWALLIREYS